ncbi:hypothetical protein [Nocardia asiatica]|uniref:hypothetical protein n=1 Tax=Nocardia asiatica TaxID=209252 RepID=UPI003EDFFA31
MMVRTVRIPAAVDFAASHQRQMGAPVRRSFVTRASEEARSPLAQLLSARSNAGGGRGGRQRLALLLTALWVCARQPYATQRAASWWAEMIGLPEPRGRAATRAVTANLHELAARGFIGFERGRAGYSPTVTLRNELGDGGIYQRPHLDAEPNYFRVPETLWTEGAIGELDARGLAMYLVVLSRYNAITGREVWFAGEDFHRRYGLSEATRLNGLNQLVNQKILTMRQAFPDVQHAQGYRATKRRYYKPDPLYAPPVLPQPQNPNHRVEAALSPRSSQRLVFTPDSADPF